MADTEAILALHVRAGSHGCSCIFRQVAVVAVVAGCHVFQQAAKALASRNRKKYAVSLHIDDTLVDLKRRKQWPKLQSWKMGCQSRMQRVTICCWVSVHSLKFDIQSTCVVSMPDYGIMHCSLPRQLAGLSPKALHQFQIPPDISQGSAQTPKPVCQKLNARKPCQLLAGLSASFAASC